MNWITVTLGIIGVMGAGFLTSLFFGFGWSIFIMVALLGAYYCIAGGPGNWLSRRRKK